MSWGKIMGLAKEFIRAADGSLRGIRVPKKDIELVLWNHADINELVIKHHYAHKPAANSRISMGVVHEGHLRGAVQIGVGIRPQVKTGKNDESLDPAEVYEFDRMWLADEMPKFSESIVLSCVHRFLRFAYPHIKWLISYADTSAGNPGTIYQAANYELVKEIKCDFYLIEQDDGTVERVHPVSIYHRHGHRRWADLVKIYGDRISKPKGFVQRKYLYDLTRGKRPLIGNEFDIKKGEVKTAQTSLDAWFS